MHPMHAITAWFSETLRLAGCRPADDVCDCVDEPVSKCFCFYRKESSVSSHL